MPVSGLRIPSTVRTLQLCRRRDYKQSDATGFISIYGLPTKVQAIVNNEKEGK